ncbi:hypothetical protein M405DRAFT_834919 [Rhizopogon salebrosus TDB-379]|nr:hypothetical protein M405DRAFT_834919 [Rhizopogon salebrosus TDB-379]
MGFRRVQLQVWSLTPVRIPTHRTALFGVVNGAASGQDIKLTETIRADEVLRGLGVTDGSSDGDVREEEVKAIWARECGCIARESKTKSAAD